MSKWEESFKKSSDKPCHCKDNQGLFIPSRQLSALIAGILSISFCIFITGYFWGKRTTAQQFIESTQRECQDDGITLSSFALNENESDSSNDQSNVLLVTAENNASIYLVKQNENPSIQNYEILANEEVHAKNISAEQYYAQLIGFGTEKAARQFVAKISSKGIATEVKKRISKTAKGQISYWYQVVTMPYHNKNDLLAIVDKLSKEEKLKGVCIRSC